MKIIFTNEFKIRSFIAVKLIKLANWILGGNLRLHDFGGKCLIPVYVDGHTEFCQLEWEHEGPCWVEGEQT